jgi:hypothetical protein
MVNNSAELLSLPATGQHFVCNTFAILWSHIGAFLLCWILGHRESGEASDISLPYPITFCDVDKVMINQFYKAIPTLRSPENGLSIISGTVASYSRLHKCHTPPNATGYLELSKPIITIAQKVPTTPMHRCRRPRSWGARHTWSCIPPSPRPPRRQDPRL